MNRKTTYLNLASNLLVLAAMHRRKAPKWAMITMGALTLPVALLAGLQAWDAKHDV